MSNINQKLIALIRPLIKEELKLFSKMLAPLIEKEVDRKVNKILAEQFIRGMSNQNNSSLGGVFSESIEKPEPKGPVKKTEDAARQKQLLKERYESKMNNLNIPKEDWHLFEDATGGIGGKPGSPNGIPTDSDDEGVDLSAFGL